MNAAWDTTRSLSIKESPGTFFSGRHAGKEELEARVGKASGRTLFASMKTSPPSRLLTGIARNLTLLVFGISCATTWFNHRNRLRFCSLVLRTMQNLTRQGMMSETQMTGTSQVALVPGTSIRGALLRQRIEAAARLYHSGIVSHLILSGDGRSANYNEPHAMRQMLVELGVPRNALIEDAGGLSTYDSVQRASRIAAGHRMIIVTQELHCPRALLLAWGMGVNACACALPATSNEASIDREEKACIRALLDLAGLREWTEEVEHDKGLKVVGWRLGFS